MSRRQRKVSLARPQSRAVSRPQGLEQKQATHLMFLGHRLRQQFKWLLPTAHLLLPWGNENQRSRMTEKSRKRWSQTTALIKVRRRRKPQLQWSRWWTFTFREDQEWITQKEQVWHIMLFKQEYCYYCCCYWVFFKGQARDDLLILLAFFSWIYCRLYWVYYEVRDCQDIYTPGRVLASL